jgi:hypothetical protein
LGKSRDISIHDYYSLLQIEYLNYLCRYKIYKREEDIKKFSDICIKKREKIESISKKNNLLSIFNSEEYKKKYIEKFLNEWGLPNFHYRDDYQKKVKGHWDKVYFLFRGGKVEVKIGGSIILATIKYLDYESDYIDLVVEEEERKYQHKTYINNIRRVLPDDFFKTFL